MRHAMLELIVPARYARDGNDSQFQNRRFQQEFSWFVGIFQLPTPAQTESHYHYPAPYKI